MNDRPFDLRTHNGIVTVTSRATGEHRTLRIVTQKDDATFMPGQRLVQLLTGPDNGTDYRSIGLIGSTHRRETEVVLWKKHRKSRTHQFYARYLEAPEKYTEKVHVTFEGRCRKCSRRLTTPQSVKSGIGPVCESRVT